MGPKLYNRRGRCRGDQMSIFHPNCRSLGFQVQKFIRRLPALSDHEIRSDVHVPHTILQELSVLIGIMRSRSVLFHRSNLEK